MKAVMMLILAGVGVASTASLNTEYLPPKGGPIFNQPKPFGANSGAFVANQVVANQVVANRHQESRKGPETKILRLESDVNVDGSYRYAYETDDGTQAQEEGHLNGESVEAQGSFSYVGPDGVQYSITYTSGEQGFLPQGAHIPTAPPVPEEILKGLEQNAAEEARGIFDDGEYRPEAGEGVGSAVISNKAKPGGYKY